MGLDDGTIGRGGWMSDSELSAGSELFGYRVERLLGRGGMGVVYLCEDPRLRRPVALKLLTASLALDYGFRERFLAEAELAASLDHPHVVPIYEAGNRDGNLFIAMRYVEGSDLKALIHDGPLTAERALRVCAQVADALDFAHEHGLVHGDVKPSNVLLDDRDHAYLADFGVTRRLEHPQAVEPGLLGTIDYVAPELIRGEQLDGRADEYSLGCLLYECLTGEPPFARSTNAAVLFAHLEEPPPAPPGLELVMGTVLAKAPADRYRTCAELVAAAAQALGIDEHAEWGRRATEWDRHGRDRAFLLTGAELDAAEHWRRETADREPAPTVLHGEFIDASRQAVTRRLRRTRGLVTAALLVAVGLAVLAFVQRQTAISNQRTAQSLQLAASAEATLAKDPELSTLLAMQALRVRDTPQAEEALRDALPQLRVLGTMRTAGPLADAALNRAGTEVVTAGRDGVARIWSTTSHKQLAVLASDGQPLYGATFSPDGRMIVTASDDGTARIWSATTHRQLAVLREPSGAPVSSAAFSPDGREIVTASYDGAAHVWSVSGHNQLAGHNELPQLFEPNGAALFEAAFSPDGRQIVTASDDGTARIWSATSHQQLGVLVAPHIRNGNLNAFRDAQFSPNGKEIVTAGYDDTARIWSATSYRQIIVLGTQSSKEVLSASFSPDGNEVVTTEYAGTTATIWSAASGKQLGGLAGHTAAVNAATFSANGLEIVTASDDGTARLWRASPVEQVAVLGKTGRFPGGGAFRPDGREVLITSVDGTTRIWSVTSHRQLAVFDEPGGGPIIDAAFSPDGKEIVTASLDGTARIWSVISHRQLALPVDNRPLGSPVIGVWCAAFSPDGKKIVTCDLSGSVSVITAGTHSQRIASLGTPAANGEIYSATFSPDGRLVVTAGFDGNTRIFNATTGRLVGILREPNGSGLFDAAFSPDGKEIVTASFDGTARIWSTTSHQQLGVLEEPTGSAMRHAAFSPDGRQLLTQSLDGTARIWSVASHQQLTIFNEPGGPVLDSVAFSPDGRQVLIAAEDGTVQIWSTELAGPIQALERMAQRRLTRQLTPNEKQLYNVP